MFSPTLYTAVRRPLLEAETMPPWCYTSPDFYEREVERIFHREWNFIGRADRIPNPGDYFTLEFAGVPLVVVRGRDGAVRAFSNVCRHRGARIMSGEGNAKSLRCPYHSWNYALDGRLERAPEMHDTRGFDPGDYGLKPVRLETRGRAHVHQLRSGRRRADGVPGRSSGSDRSLPFRNDDLRVSPGV